MMFDSLKHKFFSEAEVVSIEKELSAEQKFVQTHNGPVMSTSASYEDRDNSNKVVQVQNIEPVDTIDELNNLNDDTVD